MKIVDDRKPEQAKNEVLVVARDTFLSGWGEAAGGKSYAAWSCKPEDAKTVERWVSGRTDMANVSIQYADYIPKNAAHYHIYNADINSIKNQLNNKNTLNPKALERAKMTTEKENIKFSKDINNMTKKQKQGIELD